MRLLALFLMIIMTPLPSQAGWKEIFFPHLRQQDAYDPTITMTAPFADQDAAQKTENNDITIPLNLPHATDTEVQRWVEKAVSDALNFSGHNFEQERDDALSYFTSSGQPQYLTFLQSLAGYEGLRLNQFQLNSALSAPPLLTAEQEAGGRYKWSFEVDVLMSYFRPGARDYRDNDPQNRKVSLQVQVTRASRDQSEDRDVLIELWQKK